MLGVDMETFPHYAEYTAFHFHNFVQDFNATRFKLSSYGHPKPGAMTREIQALSHDLQMMYRCVKNVKDVKWQRWRRVKGGFKAAKPFMPIYFQDEAYRRRRHAFVRKLVDMDDHYIMERQKEQPS